MKEKVTDQDGFTQAEREFMDKTNARWHERTDSTKRGWYLPHDGCGLPLRSEDRAIIERSPFGTFLGATMERARKNFAEMSY